MATFSEYHNVINAKANDHNGDIGNINTAALGGLFLNSK